MKIKLFEEKGVLKKGHFVLSSGKHSDIYFDKRVISKDKVLLKKVCEQLADLINIKVSVIVSPEKGAIPFGKTVADILKVKYVTARKDGSKGFIIKDIDLKNISGKNVAIVEDVLTTGESTKKAINAVKRCKGHVIQVAGILDRSGGKAKSLLKISLRTLLSFKAQNWNSKNCQLCKKGEKINTKIGHGASYLS